VEIALGQLKRPYRYGGISPKGFDCSGLVYYAYSRSGVEIPRTSIAQYRQSTPIRNERIQPGDLLFFRIARKSPSHVGLYVGEGQFVHASTSERRVTLSQLESPYWRNRLIGAGRY
jgi:cell wall-associated NlpC family hydrolase